MMYLPTPAEFLAMTDPDEDEFEDDYANNFAAPSVEFLSSIAESLRQLVDVAQGKAVEDNESDRLREAASDLAEERFGLLNLLEEIQALIKPSTSKLANSVRDAIDKWNGVAPTPEPVEEPQLAVQPAHDASVEEWQTYAHTCGVNTADIRGLNRSQIRTLLGIEQPA